LLSRFHKSFLGISKSISLALLILFVFKANAQDIHFSQFYAAPLQLSPSYAGSYLGTRFIANYRMQWPSITNAFNTSALSIDHRFPELNSGIGMLITHDSKGDLDISTSSIGLLYSYDINIKNKFHFRPGIQFAYCFSGIDPSTAVTRDMIQTGLSNSSQAITRSKVNYFDASLSGLFYNHKIWAGLTINHLTRPNAAFGSADKIPMEYSLFSGIKLGRKGRLIDPPDENLTLAFHFMKMATFNQLNIGVMGFKEFIRLGVWYRGIPVFKDNPGSDAIIFSIGFEKDQISAGFSHDFTISGLSDCTNGANEVFVAYKIPYSKPKKKYTAIPCPVF